MSRLGKNPIALPTGVEVKVDGSKFIQVKGPKGLVTVNPEVPSYITVTIDGQTLVVGRVDDEIKSKQMHGLYRSLIANAVKGVVEGYEKNLQIIGVGYRAELSKKNGKDYLDLKLGFSHPTGLEIPKGLQVTLADNGTKVSIKGIDQIVVGKFAADVRAKKPPEPYKGKGIRYKDEYVRKKDGKAAKGKA